MATVVIVSKRQRQDGRAAHGWSPAGELGHNRAGKRLWTLLEAFRTGTAGDGGVVPIKPWLNAEVKFFSRYKEGAIRDGVLLSVEKLPVPRLAVAR
jgi:hypothetical protein